MAEIVYDVKGYPIMAGDLLRTFHFRDGRRNTYLHHVAVEVRSPDDEEGRLFAEPVSWLSHRDTKGGGSFLIHESTVRGSEIIQGLCRVDGELIQWYERKRRKPIPAPSSRDASRRE